MPTVNIHEAKTHLSKLLARVARGEEVVIARAGRPVARLVPVTPARRMDQILGIDKGRIWIARDFTAPLPRASWPPSRAHLKILLDTGTLLPIRARPFSVL